MNNSPSTEGRPATKESKATAGLDEVFPIVIGCDHRGWSDFHFQRLFLSNKPDGLIWFAYDVIINSPTEVEFVVYNMADSCYGGVGAKIASFSAVASVDTTRDAIERRIRAIATERRNAELQAAESIIIDGYADDIRAALSKSTGGANV